MKAEFPLFIKKADGWAGYRIVNPYEHIEHIYLYLGQQRWFLSITMSIILRLAQKECVELPTAADKNIYEKSFPQGKDFLCSSGWDRTSDMEVNSFPLLPAELPRIEDQTIWQPPALQAYSFAASVLSSASYLDRSLKLTLTFGCAE